jgi:hypothetical protein
MSKPVTEFADPNGGPLQGALQRVARRATATRDSPDIGFRRSRQQQI